MVLKTLFALFCSGLALARPDDLSNVASEYVKLTAENLPLEFNNVEYLIDPTGEINFSSAEGNSNLAWQRSTESTFGMQPADVWMRFHIENETPFPAILEHRWNLPIDEAQLFWRHNQTLTEIKPSRSYAPLFELNLPRGSHEFYLHLKNCKSHTMKSRFRISNAFEMHAKIFSSRDFIALLYGVTIATILLNLGWLLIYKRSYFLYYILYSLSMLGILAVASFHMANFSQWLWNSMLLINAFAVFLFMTTALSMRTYTPRIFYAMIIMLITMAVLMAPEIAYGRHLPWYVPQIGLYAASIIGAIIRHRQGYKPATFLMAGWTLLTAGYVINALAYAASVGMIWRYSLYLAFAVESIFFAIAVGYKARLAELKVTIENTHAFRQMEKVFYPHQIQQIRTGIELELTMPTGSGEACVLCFDIVGSSKINHEKTKDFLRNVFRRCNEAMDDGYDPSRLIASGFRIKEMGDGFICSVGYPFKSLSGSMATDGLGLAIRFLDIFQEEVEKFAYHEPLYCCIALAMDSISGFYPSGGTRSYDLYGRSIILATRYETMRKVMFPSGMTGSVLIAQERVFYSLSAAERSKFTKYSLRDNHATVRDDSAAEALFYLVVGNSAPADLVSLPLSA